MFASNFSLYYYLNYRDFGKEFKGHSSCFKRAYESTYYLSV